MSEKEEIHTSKGPAEELLPGKTENLSSALHKQANSVDGHDQSGERGQRAGFDRETGAVSGSGANAGGGGAPGEDYDQDEPGGEAKAPPPASAH